jgi:hypothetical protein
VPGGGTKIPIWCERNQPQGLVKKLRAAYGPVCVLEGEGEGVEEERTGRKEDKKRGRDTTVVFKLFQRNATVSPHPSRVPLVEVDRLPLEGLSPTGVQLSVAQGIQKSHELDFCPFNGQATMRTSSVPTRSWFCIHGAYNQPR